MKQIDSMRRVKLQNHECKICDAELEEKAIELTAGRTKDLICEKCGEALSQFLDIPIKKK